MKHETERRWAELTRQFPVRTPTRSHREDDVVLPGQLREAVWGEIRATVLIVAVDDAAAQVGIHPVTLEPGVVDAASMLLHPEATGLRSEVSVWPHVTVFLSYAVLDAAIAEVTEEVVRLLASEDHEGEDAVRFPPLPGSGAAMAIDELFDSVDRLASVRASFMQVNAPPARRAPFPLALPVLMKALQIPQPTAMAVIRGKHALTYDQAEIVARLAEVDVETVLAASLPLPVELQRELLEPRWRGVIRQRATADGEQAAREALGREAFALAARASGEGRDLWRQLLLTALTRDEAGR